jgi:hypothetical protein
MTPEEQVIRDWLDGQLSPSGAPLPPSQRRSEPLPRRRVVPVIATLIELLDEARADAAAWHDAEEMLPDGARLQLEGQGDGIYTAWLLTGEELNPDVVYEKGKTPAAALRLLIGNGWLDS